MRTQRLALVSALAVVGLAGASSAAESADDDVARDFYTTFYGYLNPVEPGGTVTWYASGKNADVSTTALTKVART